MTEGLGTTKYMMDCNIKNLQDKCHIWVLINKGKLGINAESGVSHSLDALKWRVLLATSLLLYNGARAHACTACAEWDAVMGTCRRIKWKGI